MWRDWMFWVSRSIVIGIEDKGSPEYARYSPDSFLYKIVCYQNNQLTTNSLLKLFLSINIQ